MFNQDNYDYDVEQLNFFVEQVEKLISEKKKVDEELEIKTREIHELKPKANYCDQVLDGEDLVPVSIIAKDYGKSAVWLNRFLSGCKIQFKRGDVWVLYQKFANLELTSTRTYSYKSKDGRRFNKIHTYWTQKGRLFIHEVLKHYGYNPLANKA